MSSMLLNPIHFNSAEKKLVRWLNTDENFRIPFELKVDYPELYGLDRYDFEARKMMIANIFKNLKRLSNLCWHLQYKSHYVGTLNEEVQSSQVQFDTVKDAIKINRYGLLKALRCINYQIELSHLIEVRQLDDDERKAMKFLEVMINEIALAIVMESEKYQEAQWEITKTE